MSQSPLPAHQARSRAARDRIIAALEAALREKPFEQITVTEIAARAGVAVGTLYQRFKNKDALFPVLFEIFERRARDWNASDGRIEIRPTDDLRAAIEQIIRKTAALYKREAHLLRAIHLRSRMSLSPDGEEARPKLNSVLTDGFEALLKRFSKEVGVKDLKRAGAFSVYFINSIFIEKVLYAEHEPATVYERSDAAFAKDCAEMLYLYLAAKTDRRR